MHSHWKSIMLLAPTTIVSVAYCADYLTIPQAQKILFPEADQFLARTVKLDDEQLEKIKQLSGTRQRSQNPSVWRALKKGKLLGLFIVDEVVGKHEFITYSAAISPDGKILGLEIISYRESHGNEILQTEWRKNFVGKKIADPFKLDVDIPNISGATLSCRNVLDGTKRLLALQQVIGNE